MGNCKTVNVNSKTWAIDHLVYVDLTGYYSVGYAPHSKLDKPDCMCSPPQFILVHIFVSRIESKVIASLVHTGPIAHYPGWNPPLCGPRDIEAVYDNTFKDSSYCTARAIKFVLGPKSVSLNDQKLANL